MSRGVRKSSYNTMKNRGRIILSIFLLSKEISEIFLGGIFFLTRWGGLSILKLIMSNAVKYHSVYMEFLLLKFSWRRTAVCFKFLYFVDEKCILQNQKRGSERSFWWSKSNLFKKASGEKKVFILCTYRGITLRNSGRFSR